MLSALQLTACRLMIVIALSTLSVALTAQETRRSTQFSNPESSQKIADSFEFTIDSGVKLDLLPRPVLRYTNPQRGHDQHGDVFVWTQNELPVVIGSIWSARSGGDESRRRLNLELLRVRDRQLTGTLPSVDGQTRSFPTWKPTGEPDGWLLVSMPTPVDASAVRLRSLMGRVARRFDATVFDWRTGEASELRLLSRPLHTYAKEEVLMGGLYAFVQATDPEIVMLIEARREQESVQWRYRFGRLTGKELVVMDGDELVWKVPRAAIWAANEAYLFCTNAAQIVSSN